MSFKWIENFCIAMALKMLKMRSHPRNVDQPRARKTAHVILKAEGLYDQSQGGQEFLAINSQLETFEACALTFARICPDSTFDIRRFTHFL